jgi:hypothetical protein
MKQIHSSIDIKAPASVVWAILTDFALYPGGHPNSPARGHLKVPHLAALT